LVNSLIDQIVPAGIVPKQRVVDLFSGDTVDERWTLTETGSGSTAIADEINGGVVMTTGTTTNDNEVLSFNGIDQYAYDGSAFITVAKASSNTDSAKYIGLNSDGGAWGDDRYYFAENTSKGSNYNLTTFNSPNPGNVDCGIARDTSWHKFKAQINTTSCRGWIDDVFVAVITGSSLPNAALEPRINIYTETTAAKTMNVRYYEAYNT